MPEPTVKKQSKVERFAVQNEACEITAQRIWVFYNSHIAEHAIAKNGVVSPAKWVDTKAVLKRLDRTHRPAKAKKEAPCFLPYHILCATADRLVWYVPPSKRTLSFTGKDLIHLSGKEVSIPGMVFSVEDQSISASSPNAVRTVIKGVFAVIDGKPTPLTILHEAPFPNCHRNGGLCHGSMKRYGVLPSDAELWTDSFFQSSFTHNTDTKYWNAVAKGKSPKLKATDKTIEDYTS